MPSSSDLAIDLYFQAGDWPDEADVTQIAHDAIDAALSETNADLPEKPELSLVFSDDSSVQALNKKWRNKDQPTNVLSFAQVDGPVLGDIVLACETVRRESDLAKISLDHHMAHLIIHGFLHILGYDHGSDDNADHMEDIERRALARIGIADPYAVPGNTR